jgi:3-phosphoshikimate 1-carboxyvinyltransferase
VADLVVSSAALRGVEIGGDLVPRLIDELPVLAVAASQAEGVTLVRDAGELRHKESDRIRCVVASLSAMGADITEREDGFEVHGPRRLRGAHGSSCGDHRIAMAMAVAGLAAQGETEIEESEVVGISYPSFFEDLARLAV